MVRTTELELDSPVDEEELIETQPSIRMAVIPNQENLGPEVDPPMHSIVLGDQSPNNSLGNCLDTPEIASEESSMEWEKKGKRGRQRKYSEVRKVIVFRYKKGRYWSDLSEDMQEYYEYWYFVKPNKRKDKKNHARHVKSYKRGQSWLSGDGTMGHSDDVDLSEE